MTADFGDEVYMEPSLDMLDLLDQTEIWCTDAGEVVKVDEMSFTHVLNLIGWFELRAHKLKWTADWRMTFGGPVCSGDAARDAFDDAHRQQLEEDDMEWLNARPLMRRLREITS